MRRPPARHPAWQQCLYRPVNIRGLTAKPSSATLQPTSGIHLGYVDVVSISDALIICIGRTWWCSQDAAVCRSGGDHQQLL